MTSLAAFDGFCRGLPGTNFVVQWGGCHVHKVGARLFALSMDGYIFKATPVSFALLTEQGVAACAPYLRQGNWLHVREDALKPAELFAYVEDSYRMAVAALTRAARRELGLGGEVLFRPARAGEGQVLFDITEAAVRAQAGAFYTAAQVAGWMVGRDAQVYEVVIAFGGVVVAARGQEVLGFVDSAPGVVTRLYVRPDAMGLRLGARLLELGVAAARVGHEGPIWVEATLQAVGFYAKYGFVEVSRGMFADPPVRLPVEVVIMELD